MGFKYQGAEDVTDGVGLLVSILVRYPEVATINFDPGQQIVKFNFIITGVPDSLEIDRFNLLLMDSIEAYNTLEGKSARLTMVHYHQCDCFTMIEIHRDMETLAREEIDMIVSLLRDKLEDSLVADENHLLYEEDLLVQEEIIDHMLESVRGGCGDKKLYAFREEGRVLVFNK